MYCEICGTKCGEPLRCRSCYNKYGASFYPNRLPSRPNDKTCIYCKKPSGIAIECYDHYVMYSVHKIKRPAYPKVQITKVILPAPAKKDNTATINVDTKNPIDEKSYEKEEEYVYIDPEPEDPQKLGIESSVLHKKQSEKKEERPLIKITKLNDKTLFKSNETPKVKKFNTEDDYEEDNNVYKGYIPSISKYSYSDTTYSGAEYPYTKTKYSYEKLEDNEPKNEVRETEYDENSELFKEAMEAYNNLKKRKVVRGYTNYCKTCGKPSGKFDYCRSCHEEYIHKPFTTKNGYRMIYSPEHSNRDDGYAYEHRVVAEENIHRKLFSYEVVHHINGNKLDNRWENLTVLDRNDHEELHGFHSDE